MKTRFSDGWTVHPDNAETGEPIRLPHDAMIGEPRTADGGTDNHGGFFRGGTYTYRNLWRVPADADPNGWRLVFEGVYGRTRVLVNGKDAARNDAPYREFVVPLGPVVPGEAVQIEVHVDNRAVPNSRWYTGSGIYRPVWLEHTAATRIADDGIRVVTRVTGRGSDTADTIVDVCAWITGQRPAGTRVTVDIGFDGLIIASHDAAVTSDTVEVTLRVPQARLWSAEHPHLYDVRVALLTDAETLDHRVVRTGFRTITVDARDGLRVNGEAVLLRGTAVHHDNGLIGAATIDVAEWRRARLLKAAGYNAIRSAHNPLSRAFLDACDKLGLYVMDELTDVWFKPKTPHDGASQFRHEWRADAAAMIAQDRNRPSVIMYSIGNEIAEATTDDGVQLAQQIHAYFADTDPTRPTTIAVNPLLAMMAAGAKRSGSGDEAPPERKPATSTLANAVTAKLGRMMVLASSLPQADRATRGVFAAVDIAGYNYAYASYARARKRYPERVIVGTESMHGDLPAIWKRVRSIPGVIGDFSWTGWDYLGEVGLGYWTYGDEPGGIAKPYPGILAGCGTFDITGAPTALIHLIQAVWNLTDNPGIAVRPLDQSGQRPNKTPWLSTDAVSSWSWGQLSGTAEIEVYSAADEVELLLNGHSLGRKRAGERRGFVTRFRTPYQPGELLAIAYRRGAETGRSVLRTAGPVRVQLRAETDQLTSPDDLAYIWVELADDNGTVDVTADDEIHVRTSGPATLIALGTAAPESDRTFAESTTRTHRGHALAIVRGGTSTGNTSIQVTSSKFGETTLTLPSRLVGAPDVVESPLVGRSA